MRISDWSSDVCSSDLVLLGDDETVVGLAHGFQPLPRHLRQRRLVQQHAARRPPAATDAAAKLVQLRKPEALGVLPDHHPRLGPLPPHLAPPVRHHPLYFASLQLPLPPLLFPSLLSPFPS